MKHGHEFELEGGAAGWEVWRCRRCGRSAIPSVFGFLWPELLGRLFKRWRCDAHVERQSAFWYAHGEYLDDLAASYALSRAPGESDANLRDRMDHKATMAFPPVDFTLADAYREGYRP